MINLFIPTHKNNYRAYFLKLPALILFVFLIGGFNLFIKIDTKAETLQGTISIENLLESHNAERKSEGLKELIINSNLNKSAQIKAQQMLESNCWSHYCPDGKSPWEFFKESGYDYVLAGENLAEGFYSVGELMNAWMNSKTHRENILNADYREVGFGLVSGNYQGVENNLIVVVHFGTRTEQVLPESNVSINILKPESGLIVNEPKLELEGTVGNLNNVEVYLNGALNGNASINNGIFTYTINLTKEGDNYLYVQSSLGFGLSKDSNVVKISYKPKEISKIQPTTPISIEANGISSRSEIKNLINIGFIIGLASLFLIDFIVLSKTTLLKRELVFSHYHLSIFLIMGLIVFVGGYSGSILEAIKI